MTLFTVGYEGLSLVEFMALLAENDIKTIVDVRRLPSSREPGFSKRGLGSALNHSGREYVHIGVLGAMGKMQDLLAALSTDSRLKSCIL